MMMLLVIKQKRSVSERCCMINVVPVGAGHVRKGLQDQILFQLEIMSGKSVASTTWIGMGLL